MAISILNFPKAFPAILFTYDIPRDLHPLHWHDCLELGLIESGRGTFWIEGKKYPFEPGDLFLINKLEGHRAHHNGEAPACARFVYFSDRFLEALLMLTPGAGLFRLFSLGGASFVNRFKNEAVALELQAACAEREGKQAHGDAMARLHLARLLLLLVRHFSPRLGPVSTDSFSEKLPMLLDYIQTALTEELSSCELAARCGLSEAHFRKRFKAYTGRSPREWVEERRLLQARILIESKGYQAQRAAEEAGYGDYSAFQRRFKSRFGVSPVEIRKTGPHYKNPAKET